MIVKFVVFDQDEIYTQRLSSKFINDYPDSKSRKEADNIFKIANRYVNGN